MKIVEFKDIKEPVALTVGSFDGIHLGHKALLDELKTQAKKYNAKSVVLTFYPHPRKVIDPDFKMKLLTTLTEKEEILDSLNIDYLIIQKFDKEFSHLTPESFYRDIIAKHLNLKHVVTGFNHAFGKNRNGNLHFLEGIAKKSGFTISSVPPQNFNSHHISSTKIRNTLLSGNIHDANTMLGHPYTIIETVNHGRKIGRKIGFPTTNISITESEKIIPKTGVYLTAVRVGRQNKQNKYGMTNIGTRPTFDGKEISIETHIFDFSEEIYGDKIKLCFIRKIREEVKFDSVEELILQLRKDESDCRKLIE